MKFYITTPIYYVNDKPHLGHAYTTIAADVLARYHRLQDREVFFLTGTDEHGFKIQKTAEASGRSPQQWCDEISGAFRRAWQTLNIQYNNFIRTTNKRHIKAVQEVLARLYADGYIYKGRYEALYCPGCEQYKTKSDLQAGKCPEHQIIPQLRKEEAYLFKLSHFQKKLLELISKDQFQIRPESRKNEIASFLEKKKLQDIAISRPKKEVYWGIPLPFDSSQTCYVWIDAFLNYLTGIDFKGDPKKLPQSWPPDLQLMSKDILRVHATIWPALLLALGIGLPKSLFIHGYFTVAGQKMSKSLGNVVDPIPLVKKYGADPIRYFLLREFPFGSDGDFSIKRLETRYNSDLANDLGNLIQRSAVMISRYLKGRRPAFYVPKIRKGELTSATKEIRRIGERIENLQFDQALEEIFKLVRAANKLIDYEKPYKLVKKEPQKVEKILSDLLNYILDVSFFLGPFMPETSKKITKIFSSPKIKIPPPLFARI